MKEQVLSSRKERRKGILYSLFALYIIYSTDSLIVSLGGNRSIEYGSYTILGVFASVFLVKLLIRNRYRVAWDILVCVVCVVLSSMMNFDRSLIGLIKIFCLIIGYYIATELDKKRFVKAFVLMMTLIAVGSLVVYVLKDFLVGINLFPIITGYKGQQFANFIFANVRVNSISSFRNWGPFWEPGAYQAYIIVSLLFLMFEDIEFKHRNLMIIIHIITIGTVMSTTGFLAVPFLLTAFILDQSTSKKFLFLNISIVIIALCFILWFISSPYFETIFTNKFELGSDIDRIATVRYGLRLFLQKPIFGFSSAYTEEFHAIAGQSFSITNTYIANLVVFGLVMGVLSVALILRFVLSYGRSSIVTLLIFISLIVSFSGEKMLYCPLFSFMMFYKANVKCVNLDNNYFESTTKSAYSGQTARVFRF